jgi:hypothetical protein
VTRGAIMLKKCELNIKFHNPNTNEETVKYISALLAEVAVSKVIKLQEEELAKQKKAV